MKVVTRTLLLGLLFSPSAYAGLFFNSPPQGDVVITGEPREGSILTADTSTLSDKDGLGKFDYRWLRNGKSIKGKKARDKRYKAGKDDVYKALSVRVRYVDGYGRKEELVSAAVKILPKGNSRPAGLPVIEGIAQQGSVLMVDVSAISDEDGLGDFSYQWLRDGVIIKGATKTLYTLVQDDVNSKVSVRVVYIDDGGTREIIESVASSAVLNVNDAPTGMPVILGSAVQGGLLTVDTSSIADVDGLAAFHVQWLRDGSVIEGVTSVSYSPQQDDVDGRIQTQVGYTDAGGTEESILSDAVGPIENINDVGIVTIEGNATESSVLMITELKDADGADSSDFRYQWLRDGIAIAGETSEGYKVVTPDLNRYISLQVSYIDDRGATEVVISNIKGPIFPDVPKVVAPATVGPVAATGWFTQVVLNASEASASDALDGPLVPVADSDGYFRPGKNIVTWSATDSAGNVGTAEQIVKVLPIAEIRKLQVSAENRTSGEAGSAKDNTAEFEVTLNGDALNYPVTVPYTISGSAQLDGSDHSLVDGKARISRPPEGHAPVTTIPFTISADGLGEDVETIVVTLQEPDKGAVLGVNRELTIQLLETNAAPTVRLESTQVQLDANSGLVSTMAIAADANIDDVLSYDWQRESDNALYGIATVSSDGRYFSFDVSSLNPGLYKLGVVVSDGIASATSTMTFNMVAALTPLSDALDSDMDGIDDAGEGFTDSDADGVPDYLDAISIPNVIQVLPGRSDSYIMQAEPGLRLSLGEIALRVEAGSSMLEPDLSHYGFITADTVTNVGGYFDFVISDLAFAGQSVKVVIPQLVSMPALPVYRKLTASGWNDFVSDERNSISSAAGSAGYCPPPGDAVYTPGLSEGHWCLQLSIEDGGPNDSDRAANGRIRDPGGVGRFLTDVNVSSSGSGSWSVLLTVLSLLIMVTLRHIQRFEIRAA